MDRLDTMRVFVAVAEGQGFAAAARQLSMSPPAITRAVAALEQRIGARLLVRTTRTVRLTDAGARFLADAKRLLAALDEAEQAAAGAHAEPRGLLTVTGSVLFGHRHIAPIVLDFLDRHPAVQVHSLYLDRVVDLLDEGIDVAVRIAHLPDSSLQAVRVGAVRSVVCASPHYLEQHGVPEHPRDLADHTGIGFTSGIGQGNWLFADGLVAHPQIRLTGNSASISIAAALRGHGLARVLSYMIEDELASGALRVVLAEFEKPPVPIHIVHAEGRQTSARTRAFVDFAAERLRARSFGAG